MNTGQIAPLLPASLLEALGVFSFYLLVWGVVLVLFLVVGRIAAPLIWQISVQRRRIIRSPLNAKRMTTLRGLLRSTMDGLAFILATIFTLGLAVPPATLTTAIGLFSAGLGFAARPFISDVLSGVQFLLNDQFSIGEKVEIGDKDVIGTIEQITLTQTVLRGEDGELWIVPNGDVRTIRNFSRGSFSPANVHLTVAAARFDDAMEILEQTIADLGNSVVTRPEIISAAGEIGETVTLTLVLKAPYGKAPEVRRAALSRIQDELAARGMISGVEDERIAG